MDTTALLHSKELSEDSCDSESLFTEDVENTYSRPSTQNFSTSYFRRFWPTVGISFLVVYFVTTMIFILSTYLRGSSSISPNGPSIPYSPATAAISYVTQRKHATDGPEAFAGPPSNSSFHAWASLIKPGLIRVSHEEMVLGEEDPESSTEVVGGGYMGSLGVYHELHCLRRMKLFLYRDYYYPGLQGSELDYEVNHLDHCMEAIRVSLMCAGNDALYTFQWVKGETRKPRTKTNSGRVCVDWEKLAAWATERTIGTSPSLVPPVWPDEEES